MSCLQVIEESPLATNRDDFTQATKKTLADRVGWRCSNPKCRKLTVGPSPSSTDRRILTGIAAHICAAAEGGPRYDSSMTTEARKGIDNGIWLCRDHAWVIDADPEFYDVDKLKKWKKEAEESAAKEQDRNKNPCREVNVSIEDFQRLRYFSGIYSSPFIDSLKTEQFRAKVSTKLIDTLTTIMDKREEPTMAFHNEELEQIRQELIAAIERFMDHFKQQSGGGDPYYDYIDLNEIRRKHPQSVDKFVLIIEKTRALAIEVCDTARKFAKFQSGLTNIKDQTDTKLLFNYPY